MYPNIKDESCVHVIITYDGLKELMRVLRLHMKVVLYYEVSLIVCCLLYFRFYFLLKKTIPTQ